MRRSPSSLPRPAAIELTDLRFAWPGESSLIAIEQLSIECGEHVFLQGASGSGKTTLLNLIAGVLDPTAGQLRLLGTLLHTLSRSGRDRFRGDHIGFIFQMFNLIPYLDMRANVLLPLTFSCARRERVGTQHAAGEAERLLRALGLQAALFERPVTHLSIGQQQRVAAARALIGHPDVLIADEPTSSLDAEARADFLRLLANECRGSNTSLLFVSHDSSLAPLFDRSLSMRELNLAAATA